jgi:NADH-quinone oxidoreductase subunit L
MQADLNTDIVLLCTLLVGLLPLLSFVFSFLTSDRYSWLVSLNAPLLILVSAGCALFLLITQWNQPLVFSIPWFSVAGASIAASLALSNVSLVMLCVVSIVSFLVHLYSVGYMAGDNGIRKYFALLGFFTFSMQGIVLADNLLLLFIFWELVGFSSYMLIGHWTEKPEAGAAAKKAFIMNRIGDTAFLCGLMMVWNTHGSFELSVLLSPSAALWDVAASLCIFGGVIGKSAQFPLFTWLPDAMEGPTPVSALIHAATMVAAGVYLLVRIAPVFPEKALVVIACTGMITSLSAALAALFQYDIKKVLAYSTISQLGLMIMAIGLGIFHAALLHLFTHAFFKACLFLCAGSVIHALHEAGHRAKVHIDAQDIRKMGGLRKVLPVTFVAFAISGASLAGIPFFSGFLSKDAILAALWMNSSWFSWLMLVVMLGVSFITVLYTFRLLWFVFLGESRQTVTLQVLQPPMIMRAPMILLALCSLWFMVSLNPFDFRGWLLHDARDAAPEWITVFSAAWILLALTVSYFLFRSARFDRNGFLENGFYLDALYQRAFGRAMESVSTFTLWIDKKCLDRVIHFVAYAHVTWAHVTGWFDRAIIDGFVDGVASTASGIGALTRSFQGGKIQVYIFWSVFAIIIFLIWAVN